MCSQDRSKSDKEQKSDSQRQGELGSALRVTLLKCRLEREGAEVSRGGGNTP